MKQFLSTFKSERYSHGIFSFLDVIGLVILAAFLNIYNIWNLGYGNTYYAAGIKSMLTSFANFFFVSFDSASFISIDKAPLSLWMDTLFAKVFGFSGVSILLPHALEGVAVTFLVYIITKKVFGRLPAFFASLAVTLSPVNVAVYRNNTPDALLLVFILLSLWFFVKYFEVKKLKYLLLSALMIGLGFNTKMMQAFLILPAYLSVLFFFAPGTLWSRVKTTSLFLLVTLFISSLWITAVDLTPATLRPYVGSSTNDSAWNLALAYNGAERLLGESSVGGTNGFNVGDKSLLRLFQGEMGTQAGWMLLSILMYTCYFFVATGKTLWNKLRGKIAYLTLQQILTVIGIIFFLTEYIFFSFASFFHSYYLNIFAIPVVLLVGSMVAAFRSTLSRKRLLTLFCFASLPIQMYLITQVSYAAWLIPVILVFGLLSIFIFFVSANRWMDFLARGLLIISLFLAPFVWTSYTTAHADTATPIFIGGPSVRNGSSGGPGGGMPPQMPTSQANTSAKKTNVNRSGPFGEQSVNSDFLNYLKAHYSGEKYFVGVTSQQQATGFILNDNIGNVMTLGGFSGRDKAISLAELKQKINAGEIRYFLIQSGGPGGFGGGMNSGHSDGQGGGSFNANADITAWIQANCKAVSGMTGLYDCKM